MPALKLNVILECEWPQEDIYDASAREIFETEIKKTGQPLKMSLNHAFPFAGQQIDYTFDGRIQIPVLMLEFHPAGKIIWVHGENGTVLRIATENGRFKITHDDCGQTVFFADVRVKGDIPVCLSSAAQRQVK